MRLNILLTVSVLLSLLVIAGWHFSIQEAALETDLFDDFDSYS